MGFLSRFFFVSLFLSLHRLGVLCLGQFSNEIARTVVVRISITHARARPRPRKAVKSQNVGEEGDFGVTSFSRFSFPVPPSAAFEK